MLVKEAKAFASERTAGRGEKRGTQVLIVYAGRLQRNRRVLTSWVGLYYACFHSGNCLFAAYSGAAGWYAALNAVCSMSTSQSL